jgi:hypothetical protein
MAETAPSSRHTICPRSWTTSRITTTLMSIVFWLAEAEWQCQIAAKPNLSTCKKELIQQSPYASGELKGKQQKKKGSTVSTSRIRE